MCSFSAACAVGKRTRPLSGITENARGWKRRCLVTFLNVRKMRASDRGRSAKSISGCSAVGSAPALGVPWLYPGRVKEKRRKALRHLRLLDFLWLLKVA